MSWNLRGSLVSRRTYGRTDAPRESGTGRVIGGRLIGRTVSHYTIPDKLGGGGMGLVYRARDARLDRTVALKFLPHEWSHEPILRERFSREARASSALDHPHICTIFDIDETEDGQLFIAMAFCPGQTLKHHILEGQMATEQVVELAIQIAGALESAHEAGIVHRDIKPANILLTEQNQVKVVDFGLAKLAGEVAVTREGSVIGTPSYMSPEQARGDEVDGRTDLWALGTVIYELLTSRRAFSADHDRAILLAIMSRDPTPIESVRPDIPAELLRIIRRLLKRDPSRRYQSAGELLADLRRFRGESSPTEIVTQTLPSAPRVRPHSFVVHRLLPGAAAVLAVIIAATFFSSYMADEKRHILVLPFSCLDSGDRSDQLCEGLFETVTVRLAEMRRFNASLSVVPSSEVLGQGIVSAQQARRIFGVDLVIAGTVQRDGDTLRVPLQLVDTATLRQVSSQLITAADSSDFVLQDRVVSAIEDLLDVQLTPSQRNELRNGGTSNAEAASLFLEARGTIGNDTTATELNQAMELYRRALDLDPSYADALVELAEACHLRYEIAVDPIWLDHGTSYASRAVDLGPNLPSAHLAAGRFEITRQGFSQAIARLERTIELDPLNLEAYTLVAEAYEGMGDTKSAEEAIDRAIRTGPDDWLTHYGIGRFFFFERYDPERAIPYFQMVVDLLPENSVGYSALGSALFYAGDREGARRNLERAVAIGSIYEAFANLATLEFYEQNYGDSAALYEKALEILDTDYVVWNSLGEALRFSGGDPEQARAAYRRAADLASRLLEGSPEDLSLLIDLASFNALFGEEEEGRRLIARAEDSTIDDPNHMYALAAFYEQLGDRENALRWIGRCVEAGFPVEIIEDYPDFRELLADPRYQEIPAAIVHSDNQREENS